MNLFYIYLIIHLSIAIFIISDLMRYSMERLENDKDFAMSMALETFERDDSSFQGATLLYGFFCILLIAIFAPIIFLAYWLWVAWRRWKKWRFNRTHKPWEGDVEVVYLDKPTFVYRGDQKEHESEQSDERQSQENGSAPESDQVRKESFDKTINYRPLNGKKTRGDSNEEPN